MLSKFIVRIYRNYLYPVYYCKNFVAVCFNHQLL